MQLELEAHRERTNLDYWLIQYQKLIDTKPTAIVKAETRLAPELVRILVGVQCGQYSPLLAAADVLTIGELAALDDERLSSIGVHSAGARRAMLRAARLALDDDEKEYGKSSEKGESSNKAATSTNASSDAPKPSAPPLEEPVLARYELECVVCMDAKVRYLSQDDNNSHSCRLAVCSSRADTSACVYRAHAK